MLTVRETMNEDGNMTLHVMAKPEDKLINFYAIFTRPNKMTLRFSLASKQIEEASFEYPDKEFGSVEVSKTEYFDQKYIVYRRIELIAKDNVIPLIRVVGGEHYKPLTNIRKGNTIYWSDEDGDYTQTYKALRTFDVSQAEQYYRLVNTNEYVSAGAFANWLLENEYFVYTNVYDVRIYENND